MNFLYHDYLAIPETMILSMVLIFLVLAWGLCYVIAFKSRPEKQYLSYHIYKITEELASKQHQLEVKQNELLKQLIETKDTENRTLEMVTEIYNLQRQVSL